MRYLDFTYPSPEENVACDEALLDRCDEGRLPEGVLRVWEPQTSFVVLGYGNALATEVDAAACRRQGLPILRRCSGGGAVLQGPGCLNYALIMPHADHPPWGSLRDTTCHCMQRHRALLAGLLDRPVAVEGASDLALEGRKCSGNAQRRRARAVLFHGTFLLRVDAGRMAAALPLPSHQPTYRRGRTHADFLTPVPLAAGALKAALQQAWGATTALPPPEGKALADVVQRLRARLKSP